MKRVNLWLGAALVVQLVLAAVLVTGNDRLTTARPGKRLVDFDPAQVDTLVVEAPGAEPVRIVRREGAWQVPARYGFPADGKKVTGILESLASMQPRLPAATSEQARSRFHVNETGFERRLRLLSGDEEMATLYFGNSAGPGRVFVRRAGADAIYEVRFALWEANTDPAAWLDRDFLQRDPSEISAVSLPDVELRRDGEHWKVAGLDEDLVTDGTRAGTVVSRLTSIRFEDVLGRRADVPVPDAAYGFTLVAAGGDEVEYRLARHEAAAPADDEEGTDEAAATGGDREEEAADQPGDWLLTLSGSDYVFRIADSQARRIREFGRDDLVTAAGDGTGEDARQFTGATGDDGDSSGS